MGKLNTILETLGKYVDIFEYKRDIPTSIPKPWASFSHVEAVIEDVNEYIKTHPGILEIHAAFWAEAAIENLLEDIKAFTQTYVTSFIGPNVPAENRSAMFGSVGDFREEAERSNILDLKTTTFLLIMLDMQNWASSKE